MKKINGFILLLAAFLINSCIEGNPKPENIGLAAFKVEFIGDFDPGTPEKRMEAADKYNFSVKVTAIDYNKEVMPDYNGTVEVTLQYGRISSVVRADVVNGVIEDLPIEMRYAVGKERVVIHEIVLDEELSTESSPVYKRTGKLGVSPEIFPPLATISEIQGNNTGTKGFDSKYNNRNLNVKGRDMVVTAVIEGGFYLAEVGVEDYGSIYLYTYSTPYVDDAGVGYSLPVGAMIESVNGSVFEFYGFTEMSFPTFKPKRDSKTNKIIVDESLIPEPFDISAILSAEAELEKKEAAIVTVKNVTVDWFNEHDSSFLEFGQFPLKTDSGAFIMAQTLYTAPSFDPLKERDREPKTKFNVTGVLKQHTSARPSTRIIVPRDSNDIEISE
ncbi:MAG TPA: hypothetical protein PKG52_12270 [bacterium]|nr:hypothetical protein [bacterium]HPS29367.1 hypothetical protein [bacterium]